MGSRIMANHVGFTRIAFDVQDVDHAMAEALANGGKVLLPQKLKGSGGTRLQTGGHPVKAVLGTHCLAALFRSYLAGIPGGFAARVDGSLNSSMVERVPEEMEFTNFSSIHDMLQQTVTRHGHQMAYKWFTAPRVTEGVTWTAFYDQVRQVGKSLMALGVEPGDKVNVLSYSCYRWVLCDMGIASIGAATVGIYQSNLAKDCRYIIDHCDAVVGFAQDEPL